MVLMKMFSILHNLSAGSAVRRVSHPPTAPVADEGGEGHGQRSLARVLARRSCCDEEGQGVVAAGEHGQAAEQGADVGQRHQFFDLDFDHPVKYDAVNKLLLKRIPSSDEGFTIKLRAANGETEPETKEDMMSAHLDANPAASAGDRDPCDISTRGAPSPPRTDHWPASGTSAIALPPPVVASATRASRPSPTGLLALQGGLGKSFL